MNKQRKPKPPKQQELPPRLIGYLKYCQKVVSEMMENDTWLWPDDAINSQKCKDSRSNDDLIK